MPKAESIEYVILHITAGVWGSVESIRKDHTDPKNIGGRGWRAIGYHRIITNCYPTWDSYAYHRPAIEYDGMIWPGRDIDNDGDVDEEIGAHALGYNSKSIGIALVGQGGIFTSKQITSAVDECKRLMDEYGVMLEKIIGHNETGNTSKSCPEIDMDHFRALVVPPL